MYFVIRSHFCSRTTTTATTTTTTTTAAQQPCVNHPHTIFFKKSCLFLFRMLLGGFMHSDNNLHIQSFNASFELETEIPRNRDIYLITGAACYFDIHRHTCACSQQLIGKKIGTGFVILCIQIEKQKKGGMESYTCFKFFYISSLFEL